MDRYKEQELLTVALNKVRNNFVHLNFQVEQNHFLHGNYLAEPKTPKHNWKRHIDAVLKIEFKKKEAVFCVEIKNTVTKPTIGLVKQQEKEYAHPILLVTNYVNAFMADKLKQNEINFIDTVGNAYINKPPIYIFVKGNRFNRKFDDANMGQAFRPTGLQAIFTFLIYPKLINKPYRDIADTAQIALGNIGWIIADLRKQGLVLDMERHGRRIVDKKQLLDRFVEEYPRKLRHKLLIGKYRNTLNNNEIVYLENALLGGEAAAAKLTNYLKPQNITIYLKPENLNDFLFKNRLAKDDEGEVEILEQFWKPLNMDGTEKTVHPVLVYADLMATADQRNIETARMVFERYIQRHIG